MTVIELTRFRVECDRRDELLAARPRMVEDFAADRVGFLGADLVELANGEWLDVVRWRRSEDFEASRAKGANLPGIAAFFASIAELISSEEGSEVDLSTSAPTMSDEMQEAPPLAKDSRPSLDHHLGGASVLPRLE